MGLPSQCSSTTYNSNIDNRAGHDRGSSSYLLVFISNKAFR